MSRIMRATFRETVKGGSVVALFLVLISAVWIEKDSYRYASIILVVWGLLIYARADFRPTIGWAGFACIGWTAFVAARFAALYFDPSVKSYGTSEGIYLLPIFYMTVGYMMFLYRELLGRIVALFILISLVMAAATFDGLSVFNSQHHKFLIMNNTIHSSVGAGFIILAALNFSRHAARKIADARRRYLYEAASYITIAICFAALYGGKSKGVWVSIAVALCVQALLALPRTRGVHNWAKVAAFLVALAAFVTFVGTGIQSTIDPSYDSAQSIAASIVHTGHPLEVIQKAIESGTVPVNMNARLKLWSNAFEVWSHNVVLGNGIGWLDLWGQAKYQDVGFDILHNGYLEVAVRYGLVGFAFYIGLYGWSVANVNSARRKKLIPREAFDFYVVSMVFFFGTIFTNSNNRLAIGETYMMVAAAFGFCCFYMLQWSARQNAATAVGSQAGTEA